MAPDGASQTKPGYQPAWIPTAPDALADRHCLIGPRRPEPFESQSHKLDTISRPYSLVSCHLLVRVTGPEDAFPEDEDDTHEGNGAFEANRVSPRETTLRRARTGNRHRAAGRNEVYPEHWVTNIRARSNAICPIQARMLKSFATR
jgi:hypothetical protein